MSNQKKEFITQTGDKIIINSSDNTTSDGVFQQKIYGGTSTGKNIWIPNTTTINPWTLDGSSDLFGGQPVKARCYNRNCKNDAVVITELKLGAFLNFRTYICDSCLKDLADKVKSELGIEEESK